MLLSVANMVKDRSQGEGGLYRLEVPTFTVGENEKVLITGPSGSGKSTILDMLALILQPERIERYDFSPKNDASKTEVYDIAEAWHNKRYRFLAECRCRIGYILQTGGLLPFLSVEENIKIQQDLIGHSDPEYNEFLVNELGIQHLIQKFPVTLSVGERQRVAIARALSTHPQLLLADEPTAALDPHNSEKVLNIFEMITSRLSTAVILVTHAPEQIAHSGYRKYCVVQEQTNFAKDSYYTAKLLEAEGDA